MWEIENKFKVKIGGNYYIDCENILVFKGESIFTLKRHDNGYLGIYFEIYNSQGQHVASVKRNEIYQTDKNIYTLHGTADRIVLTEQVTGKVLCDIRKRSESSPAELDVSVSTYLPNGFLFDASPDATNLGGITITGNTIIGNKKAIVIA